MEHFDLKSLQKVELTGKGLPEELLLSENGRYATYYAPFEFVNESAKVVICGITPGVQQALIALETAKDAQSAGLPTEEILKRAKHAASFAGAMRRNLAEMLDFIGLAQWLGLETCADLFETRQDLVHFTSALRNPVLDQGQNFSGGKTMISNSYLWSQIRTNLLKEIESLPADCVFIPLGQGVDAVFEKFASDGVIATNRVLSGLPHASGANAERIAYFCQRKDRDRLSGKTNPGKLDEARTSLLNRVAELSGEEEHIPAIRRSKAPSPPVANSVQSESFEKPTAINEVKIKRIFAIGKVQGQPTLFAARHDRSGRYVLNRKSSSPTRGNTTNRSENKVYVPTLREAAALLESGDYLIHLVTDEGIRALRSNKNVITEFEQ